MQKELILQNLVTRNEKFYKMQAKDDVADIYIYDEISWIGISADDFVKSLNELDVSTINLHLNTPGGNIFDGIAIMNALKGHKAIVNVIIEGLAASIGSVIALAGDTVKMYDSAYFMIHNPWVITMGESKDLRKVADDLDKLKSTIVDIYVKKSGQEQAKVEQWMDEETWFTAQEALDNGFIDEIIGEEKEAKNSWSYNLSVFDNAPEVLLCKKEEPENCMSLMEMRLKLATC